MASIHHGCHIFAWLPLYYPPSWRIVVIRIHCSILDTVMRALAQAFFFSQVDILRGVPRADDSVVIKFDVSMSIHVFDVVAPVCRLLTMSSNPSWRCRRSDLRHGWARIITLHSTYLCSPTILFSRMFSHIRCMSRVITTTAMQLKRYDGGLGSLLACWWWRR